MDVVQMNEAGKAPHGDRDGVPPLVGRKSVLLGLLTSGFVVANAAQSSSASASTVKPGTIAATPAAYALKWAPATAYALGQQVTSPNNDVVSTKVAHTSSAAYSADTVKWNISSTYTRRDAVGLFASDNGVVGDGVTDDGAALNALLTRAAALGVPVVLTPLSIVRTTVEIRIPSNTHLNGNGATIRCGITSSIYTPTVGIRNVSNVVIEGLKVDGRKASYATNSEFQHCIGMRTSTDVLIRNCTLTYGAGDGIEIAGDNVSTWSERITLDNVTCLYNNRNGLSVIACKTLRVIHGSYSWNSGTLPMAGIDVEPNNAADPIEDLAFTDVLMEHNAESGFLVNLRPGHTARQEGIRVTGCAMRNNGSDGASLYTAYHVTFTDCEFNDNKYGLTANDYVKHLTIRGGVILRNKLCGILGTPVTLDDVVISGARILDNVGVGVRLSGTGSRFLVTGNIIGNDSGTSTTVGIATQSSTLSYVSIVNNHLRGISTALSLGDNAATRVNTGNAV